MTRVFGRGPFLPFLAQERSVLCQDRLRTTTITRKPQQNDRLLQGVRLARPVTAACAVRKRRKQNVFSSHTFQQKAFVLVPSTVFQRRKTTQQDRHLLPFRVCIRDWDTRRPGGKKTPFLRFHFILKAIILPRQARDKHRKNSKKSTFFLGIRRRICRQHARRVCRGAHQAWAAGLRCVHAAGFDGLCSPRGCAGCGEAP